MLTTIITVIIVIILFTLLVVGHEFGHFILAKRNGIDVEEFGIGFPPRIGKGWKRGGTLYSINWLPLGGFVRLSGEDGASSGAGTFAASSLWVKTKTLLAGVVMNLIMAVVIFFVLCLVGLPGLGSAFEPGFLHPSYAQPKQLYATVVEPKSPAAQAGMVRGDTVVSLNDKKLITDEALRDFTNAHANETVTLKYIHDKTTHTTAVKLRKPNDQGILGVQVQQVYRLRYTFLEAIVAALWITGALFVATIVAVFQLIIHLPQLIGGLFGSKVPAAAEAASGPVGIVYILSHLGSLGWAYTLLFVANISVALAGFNVLPLPALDGGRWAVAVVRKLSGGKISAESEGIYHGIGFIALLGLVAIITVYDIRKFF